jgi:hypothetical protein
MAKKEMDLWQTSCENVIWLHYIHDCIEWLDFGISGVETSGLFVCLKENPSAHHFKHPNTIWSCRKSRLG